MSFYFGTIPFVRWVLPFALGIVAVAEWNLHFEHALSAAVLTALLLAIAEILPFVGLRYTRRHWFGLLIYPFWFLAGIAITQSWSPLNAPDHYTHHLPTGHSDLIIRIESFPKEKANSTKYEAQVLRRADDLPRPLRGTFLLYSERNDSIPILHPGNLALLTSPLRPAEGPKNPGEFDYRKYLRNHGIYHQSYAPGGTLTPIGHHEGRLPVGLWFESLRSKLLDILRMEGIEQRDFGVLAALVLGKKDLIDPDTFRSFSAAGAMHVLAVSGLHVGLFYVVILWILARIPVLNRMKWVTFVIVLLSLWLYAGVTGFSPSVTRAATMFSFIALSKTREHRYKIYNVLAASGLLILVFQPMMLFEVGFQLSYLAVLGIVYLAPMLQGLWAPPTTLWIDKAWALACVSFAAQAATFPLGLLYFHQFPTYFLFSNLFVIPAATLILYIGLGYLALFWVPGLGDVLGIVLQTLVSVLNRGVALVEALPMARIEGVSISVFEVYMVYGFMLMLVLFLSGGHRWLLFGSLGCLLAISLDEAVESRRLQQADLVCFHAVNNRVAITMYRHGQGLFVSDRGLYRDRDRMTFHVGHFWDDLELRAPEVLDLTEQDSLVLHDPHFFRHGPIIGSGQIRILIARGKSDLEYLPFMPIGSIVFLEGNEALRTYARLPEWPNHQLIVNTQSRYYTPLMDSLAAHRGIPIRNLAADGYFMVNASDSR